MVCGSTTCRATPLDIVDNLILASPGAGLDIFVAFDFDRVGGTIRATTSATGRRRHPDPRSGSHHLGELRHRQPSDRQRRRRHLPQDNTFPSRVGIGPVVFAKNSARTTAATASTSVTRRGGAAIAFDGGDNSAKYNGLSPRCIGVSCDADLRPGDHLGPARADRDRHRARPDQLTPPPRARLPDLHARWHGLAPGGYSPSERARPRALPADQLGVALEVKKSTT